MCGIAGLISQTLPREELRKLCDNLLRDIHHRGPDSGGIFINSTACIGMRRLSILDVEKGNQPMANEDESVIIVYNGELYNFLELKKQLELLGHKFKTTTDTEVLLASYLEWGLDVTSRLNGMYGFAILDRIKNFLLLARDPVGIKPLYYSALIKDKTFVFCSEPDGLLKIPMIDNSIDRVALGQFLTHKYVHGKAWFVKGIRKLEAGENLVIDLNSSLFYSEKKSFFFKKTETDARNFVSTFKDVLCKSVERHLISDVPIGLFLSSGLDSSLLAWAAREITSSPPSAYTVSFDDKSFDESDGASEIAKHLDLNHKVIRLDAPAPSELDQFISLFREPFANISIPANFLLAKHASRDIKVALNGSGADELFGGYERYYATLYDWRVSLLMHFAAGISGCLTKLKVNSGKAGLSTKLKKLSELKGLSAPKRHALTIRILSDKMLLKLVPELTEQDEFLYQYFMKSDANSFVEKAMQVDFQTMLVDDYLNLVDRTSMAASLEVRVPFLDNEMIRFSNCLPLEWKINGLNKKFIMRELAKEILPETISKGRKKGFESPVGQWFRGSLANDLVAKIKDCDLIKLFDVNYLEKIIDQHKKLHADHGKLLLGLYTLATWFSTKSIRI